jgi:hypothetical protein
VDRARDEFFTGSALAVNEYICGKIGHAMNQVINRLRALARSDKTIASHFRFEAMLFGSLEGCPECLSTGPLLICPHGVVPV